MEDDIDVPLSDEETITAQKVLEGLEEAWLNEKFSPELLQHQSELVDCMMEQITQMEENIQKLNKNDFRVMVHRMELDRIRYILASYLRCRLEKIESFTAYLLDQDSKRTSEEKYMSENEYKFAKEYMSHVENHFRLLALRHMPTNVQDIDKNKMSVVPNLSSYVFLKAKKDIPGVIVEGDTENRDEEIDLDEKSQHIMQYRHISEFVKSGQVQLI